MRCEELREKLLEGARRRKLPPEIKLHLQTCVACSRVFEEYKGLFGVMEGEREPSLEEVRSPQYLVSLRQRIEASERGWVLGLPKPGLVVTLASVLVVVLLLFNIWDFSSRFPDVAHYTPSSTREYTLESVSSYLGLEEELAHLLSSAEVQEEESVTELLSTSESTTLLQAEEILYPEESLESLLQELSEEELEILSQSIQNLISALPLPTEGVKKC